MKIYNCEQGTDEWLQVRLGKITASNFGDVMAKGQGKIRRSYMIKLSAERLTGQPQDSYTNEYMEWGTLTEPIAREHYQQLYSKEIQQVGFVDLDSNIGCSPDGLIDADGLLEIKCPKTTTHLDNILNDKIQPCYMPQVQGQLWVTGRKWCDWISFDPRIKSQPMLVIRVYRDDAYIENLKKEVDLFVTELNQMIEKFTKSEF